MRDTETRGYMAHSRTRLFTKRVDFAKREIEKVASNSPVVSVSFGKDSSCLAHVAKLVLGDISMMHMACAHELPGGESVEEFFRGIGTLNELPPLNTLAESIEWLKEVGLPHERDKAAHRAIVKERKKDRGIEWCNANGFESLCLGMRADESKNRKRLFCARGPTYRIKSGITVCNPLAWWDSRDVWAYIVSNDIPWHPLYDAQVLGFTRERLRNGGWLYTDGANKGWIQWLRKSYPEQYEKLENEFPRVALL